MKAETILRDVLFVQYIIKLQNLVEASEAEIPNKIHVKILLLLNHAYSVLIDGIIFLFESVSFIRCARKKDAKFKYEEDGERVKRGDGV